MLTSSYQYTVTGDTRDDIERRAAERAEAYYGTDTALEIDIDVKPNAFGQKKYIASCTVRPFAFVGCSEHETKVSTETVNAIAERIKHELEREQRRRA